MKTNQLLLAIACMAACVTSCQQKVEEKKSFAQIIQDDPSRKQELIEEAKKLQDSADLSRHFPIDKNDQLTQAELDTFRNGAGKDDTADKKRPVIMVSTIDITNIINGHLAVGDSLIFYKGKYSSNDLKRIRRYNKKFAGGHMAYDVADFAKRKTFVIQLETMDSNNLFHTVGPVYDIARLCPPPKTGCD